MSQLPPAPDLSDLDALFCALHDPAQLAALRAVSHGETSAGKLASELGWRRDKAAKNLSRLRRAGILRSVPTGKTVLYEADPKRFLDATAWVEELSHRIGSASPDAPYPDTEERRRFASALANGRRRGQLELVSTQGRLSQSQIVAHGAASQSLVSRSMGVLVSAGLLRPVILGRRFAYEVDADGMQRLRRWLVLLTQTMCKVDIEDDVKALASQASPAQTHAPGRNHKRDSPTRPSTPG